MAKVLVVVGILVVVVLGFWFVSNITGNIITGAVVDNEPIVNVEDFRISDFGNNVSKMEELNGTQNNSG
jgi:hypothetical protein